ncbi:MAG: hypothetical protein ACK5DG_10025 [Chitinophagaceae bacterium]|jgi:hypothetical protein
MKKVKGISVIVAIMIFFTACQKNSDVFVPDPGQQLDSAWVSTITSNSQISVLTNRITGVFDNAQVNVNSTVDTSIASNTGLVIEIPRESLFSTGAVYVGTVRAEYKLILKKGDFIRYGVPTVSNRFPLESGGALLLRLFTPSGTPVTVNPSKRIYIKYVDELPKQGMSLYYSSNSPTTTSVFNWLPANDGSQVAVWSNNTTPVQKGYAISTTRTGWLNVDRLLEPALATTEVNVVLPNLFSNANTSVYMVFKNIRSVIQLSGNATTRTFSFPNIPVNADVKFVTISKVGDSYYLGIKDDKVISNYSGFVKPEISSLEKINLYLNSL